jgi:hypothetical protein
MAADFRGNPRSLIHPATRKSRSIEFPAAAPQRNRDRRISGRPGARDDPENVPIETPALSTSLTFPPYIPQS